MKCPKCKEKLKRTRTTASDNNVKRENLCPGCKKKYITIELYEDDYNNMIEDLNRKRMTVTSEKDDIQEKYDNIVDALKTIQGALSKKTKKI